VTELDCQINQTLALNRELHNQLSDHTSVATAADAALSAELNTVREAKRTDDAARSELKVRTKTLEESRRVAEAGKRDAERRLRAVQKAKEEAGTRIERLGVEIRALEAQVQQDETAVLAAGEAAVQEELDIRSRVKHRKREVRVAEEVVTALNVRVHELEESIERERTALVAAREKAEELRREQQNPKYDFILKKSQDPWEPIPLADTNQPSLALESRMDPFPTPLEKDSDRERERSSRTAVPTRSSPHLCAPNAQPPPGIGYHAPSQVQLEPIGAPESVARLAKGYSIFDEDLASLSNPSHYHSKFLPFGDSSDVANVRRTFPFIPISPVRSLDNGMSAVATVGDVIGTPEDMLSKNFQSDNNTFLGRDWPRHPAVPESVPVVGSNMQCHVFPGADNDATDAFEPFEIRPPPRHRITSDPMDGHRVWPSRGNSEAVASPITTAPSHEARLRWWQNADKERRSTIDGSEPRRGLNPDAKVFNFSGRPLFRGPDGLNASTSTTFPISGGGCGSSGNGYCSGNSSSSDSANGSTTAASNCNGSRPGFLSGLATMRAFAPSPAEREALQRALGGSTNTSLERLPSLSEVPTSPVLTPPHAPTLPGAATTTAPSNPPPPPPAGLPWLHVGGHTIDAAGHGWLRELGGSMPRPRKIKFSPWADDGNDGDMMEADK
jgi:hypothetical protein